MNAHAYFYYLVQTNYNLGYNFLIYPFQKKYYQLLIVTILKIFFHNLIYNFAHIFKVFMKIIPNNIRKS
jgi:hypothetical protein